MAGEVKITDLVDPSAIESLKKLDEALQATVDKFINVARELAKGINMPVNNLKELEELEQKYARQCREAAQAQAELSSIIEQKNKIIATTTNTISRQLMEQERVNKAQREAYTDTDKFKSLLEQINGSYENRVKRLIETKDAIAANKKQQDDLKKSLEAGRISQEQYTEQLVQLTITERELKQSKADLEAQMKNEEREMQSVAGSYRNLSQRLELMKKAYKDLTAEEKSAPFGKEIEAAIQSLDAHLKDLAADMGEHQRNVGNYAIAGESVKKSLKELVLEIANLTVAYNQLSEEEQKSAEGVELREHIQELTEQAGVLRDAIADTTAAVNNAASDTRGFDQMSESIQLAIDGFGLAQGAAEMLGISEEELAEIQTKLQAAIAASNAMTKIQTTLQKQSALMQAASLMQTKLRVKAEQIHVAAQGKNIVVTKAATVAQWGFNAAANANPIGLIVVAIVACIAAVYGLVKAYQAFIGPSRAATEELQNGVAAVENMKESHEELISVLEKSGASQATVSAMRISNLNAEVSALERVIEQAKRNNADEEEIAAAEEKRYEWEKTTLEEYETQYFGLQRTIREQALEDIKAQQGEATMKRQMVNDEIDGQIRLLETLREVAKARGYSIAQYDSILEALEKKRARKLEKIEKEEKEANERRNRQAADAAKKRKQQQERDAEELRKAVRAGEDAMLKIIVDSNERQRQAELLSYNRQLADLQEKLAKTKTTEVTLRLALHRHIQGITEEHMRKMESIHLSGLERVNRAEYDFIQSHLDIVQDGSDEQLEWSLKALQNQKQAELLAISKGEADKTYTEEQANIMRANLEIKYARLREEAESQHAGKAAEAIQKRYADEQDAADNALLNERVALKKRYAEELALAGNNQKKIAEIKERYEFESAQLSKKYARETAQRTIEMLQEILKNEKLTAEERKRIEKELAKAKGDLEEVMADDAINNNQQKNKIISDDDLKNAQRWLQVASESLNAINDLATSVFDARISRIEEEQEANQAASDAEIERINDLVEKKAITEEEGEARKRAAEAQTAQKNEELEKKKQQLKYKQAVWDKANGVAQAGISTALAILNALNTQPFPVGIAMAAIAGAMGAVQIATILATPIPKYAKGTDRHKGGPAIVGDGGVPEVVILKNAAFLTPDTPTLVDLPTGAKVAPSVEDFLINHIITDSMPVGPELPQVVVNTDNRKMESKLDEVSGLLKALLKSRKRSQTNARMAQLIALKGL